MKNLSLIACLFTVLGMVSCKKDNSTRTTHAIIPPATVIIIIGDWNVVSDSTSSGVGAVESPTTTNYIGKSGDYFHFTSTGNLFAKEGGVLVDTASYLIKDKELSLTYKYLFQNGTIITNGTGSYAITTITQHSLMLTKQFVSPGGFYFEYISLSR